MYVTAVRTPRETPERAPIETGGGEFEADDVDAGTTTLVELAVPLGAVRPAAPVIAPPPPAAPWPA